jgi:hypothetical protein
MSACIQFELLEQMFSLLSSSTLNDQFGKLIVAMMGEFKSEIW